MSLGIKETTEVIECIGAIKNIVVVQLKDGFQKDDLEVLVTELLNNPAMKMKLEKAVEGIDLVLAELKDLSLTEKISLISLLIKHII
jgi:hypothetical protein